MPAISMFYGIIIRMQSEKGGKHNIPHLHAVYDEHEVVMDFTGKILEGSFPSKQLTLLTAWTALHEEVKIMLRPTAISVTVQKDYTLKVIFDNGETKVFDVKPYIKGSWYSQLKNFSYFSLAKADGFTVIWPDG